VLVYDAFCMTPASLGPSALAPAALAANFAVKVAGRWRPCSPSSPECGARGGAACRSPAAASLAIGKAGLRSLAASLHAGLVPQGIHAATVTIAGAVAPGTAFDPNRIAEAYWALHRDPPGAFRAETIYKG
jgi:hypothetical protein